MMLHTAAQSSNVWPQLSLSSTSSTLNRPSVSSSSSSSSSFTFRYFDTTSSSSSNQHRRATMASAAVTATMAATGFDKRTNTSCSASLQTPGSGTFPSALRSPSIYSPGLLRREDALKTPITPPSAYLDFLRNTTPALMSPMSTSTSSRFNISEKPITSDAVMSCGSTPASQPALSRNTSYGSDASTTSSSTTASEQSMNTTVRDRPESPRITIPPSPFLRPGPRSARTPRRLQIPQSPYSPMNTTSSAQSPLSAAPWSASFSPRDADPEVNGKPGKVSVRHVVTRTVTYCRTPLEPAPRGKRRRIEEQESSRMRVAGIPGVVSDDEVTPKKSDKTPMIKQETDVEDLNIAPELRS